MDLSERVRWSLQAGIWSVCNSHTRTSVRGLIAQFRQPLMEATLQR